MTSGGISIGLHFDETAYPSCTNNEKIEIAENERKQLESIVDVPVRVVSMHRPSKTTLEDNWKFANMVNTYSDVFFKEFKYLSDSRKCWREPIWDIISGRKHEKLQILTHAFWYDEKEKSMHDILLEFINAGNLCRYSHMTENLTDLQSVIEKEEIKI